MSTGHSVAHDSAVLHVTGEARYIDDLPEVCGTVHAALGLSARAHARIVSLDLEPVRAAPGVVAVISAADIPGENDFGAVVHDDPILAEGTVRYAGQPVFAVAATSTEAARRAARLGRIEYADLPARLTVDEALDAGEFVLPSERMQRGDPAAALGTAPHRIAGTLRIGGQEQFYLEGQIAYALPQEDGCMRVWSSTQHPTEVQHKVAHALGVHFGDVVVECRRMGGGFGGKESQPSQFACIAAILARVTGRPVKLRLDRDDDMIITGKRHDYRVDYDAGFDGEGRLLGVEFAFASRCGHSTDLSASVNDRTMFHADNAYFLPAVGVTSHRCRTNTVSNTAFRGFGGPQGMLAIEYVVDEVARVLDRDPLEVRRLNLYGIGERDETHYGMKVQDNILPQILADLERSSEYRSRREAVGQFNRASPVVRRGLALTPVKFGISFTATHLNQAGALLHLYTDGTLLLNHGGTEMGQGLFTKVAQVVAAELGVELSRIRISASDTSKVPNTSPTAASSGSDLNGMAAAIAARTLRARLSGFASRHFGVDEAAVHFRDGEVLAGPNRLGFAALAQLAYMARVPLSATGFYATPKIGYDRRTWRGRPFYYFAYGAAVTEVSVDTLTGETRLERVDILHDAGRSLNPAIDLGQVEGGYLQGVGWLTCEELWWDAQGSLRTHGPSTYKIPACRDWPRTFNVRLVSFGANREPTVYRSKAVGEPPLMLGISAFLAIRDAIASVGGAGARPPLDAPATPEAILRAVDALRARAPSDEGRVEPARSPG